MVNLIVGIHGARKDKEKMDYKPAHATMQGALVTTEQCVLGGNRGHLMCNWVPSLGLPEQSGRGDPSVS